MTLEELKAIKERAEAATPAPWVCHLGAPDDAPANTCRCRSILAEPYCGAVGEVFFDNGKKISDGGNDCPPYREARANARFIAAARSDVPALIAEVERLRAALRDAIAAAESANKTDETCAALSRARDALGDVR